MSSMRWIPLAAASAVVAPLYAPHMAHAVQYATAEEAAKRAFPEATTFTEKMLQVSAEQLKALPESAGVAAKPLRFRALVAMKGNDALGTVVVDSVIGKFELIDYAVSLSLDNTIRAVEILTYRESHGYEVRLPAWRKQFVGKNKTNALRVSEDIANISGATMSATHVTDGVRRITWALSAISEINRQY